jgi:hypothetical protein
LPLGPPELTTIFIERFNLVNVRSLLTPRHAAKPMPRR